MNADKAPDQLSRSIRVINIPTQLDKDVIIDYLKSAGEISDVISDKDQLLITYETVFQRNTSLNLNGHLFESAGYTLQLEEPKSLSIPEEKRGDDADAIRDEFEVVQGSPGSESPVGSMQKIPDDDKIQNLEEGFEQIGLEEADKDSISSEEIVGTEIDKAQTATEKEEETEKGAESPQKEDNSSDVNDVLKELGSISISNKRSCPEDDPFQDVFKKNYLITFTFGWAVILFIRSVV